MPYSECCNCFIETISEDICPSCKEECEWRFKDEKVVTKKIFSTPPKDRRVTVRIYPDNISFHFTDEGDNEFYWIYKDEWVSDRTERLDREDNWHRHMKTKNWFTDGMYDFINDNT